MLLYNKFLIFLILINLNIIYGSHNINVVGFTGNSGQYVRGPNHPRFLQANPNVEKDKEPTFFSLLFHPKVKEASMDIGMEDSNVGVMKTIGTNEEEDHINELLNELEENEQNQVNYFYNNFDLQNAQLKEISKLF
ncbi:uncharacterized protein TA04545 [Theileria annulata]|uniref:Uncharacterized protein n=1 Tax=Theileria annulata TaxID=5874 RepID=Q4UC04_THEAN|nr:uncharacterized protein TA04545 [Theileria annulata]CAI75647.1 hypothetical protein TA04545 [Theileria annulata]|eukprot:XP_955123.1 hypothetical protein TA04545 [Theileria annulata]